MSKNKPKAPTPPSKKVSIRITVPYLQGAFLALNAIPDAYFLVDGPSCIFAKAEQIQGRHDLFSTLLSCDSEHRIQHTGVNVFNIAGDCEGMMAEALRHIATFPGCRAIFFGAMPMCSIVGTDYDRILRETLSESDPPAFVLPRRSGVSADGLDGYADVLELIASSVDLKGAKPDPKRVALVGYFMDRNEGDHWGNLRELERMLRAVGLDAASIWLSGQPYAALREARSAGAVISLPHGRKAARILARRLGVRLIEAELPFGLEASRRFMEHLGREFGREEQASRFTAAELDRIAPRLEWTVPHAFMDRRFAIAADPHYAVCFAEIIEGLGGDLVDLMVVGGRHHLTEQQRGALEERARTVFEPRVNELREKLGPDRLDGYDLVIGNGFVFRELNRGVRWMEFGFPSECTHFLTEEPFLGFQGALAFLSRVANEVVRGLNIRPLAPPPARKP